MPRFQRRASLCFSPALLLKLEGPPQIISISQWKSPPFSIFHKNPSHTWHSVRLGPEGRRPITRGLLGAITSRTHPHHPAPKRMFPTLTLPTGSSQDSGVHLLPTTEPPPVPSKSPEILGNSLFSNHYNSFPFLIYMDSTHLAFLITFTDLIVTILFSKFKNFFK